jgi:hypothetical protein
MRNGRIQEARYAVGLLLGERPDGVHFCRPVGGAGAVASLLRTLSVPTACSRVIGVACVLPHGSHGFTPKGVL